MAANRKIAILGAGRIGESLLAGLLSSGWRKPGDIVVTGRREERLKELSAKGVTFLQEPAERPYGIETVLRDDSGNLISLVQRLEGAG